MQAFAVPAGHHASNRDARPYARFGTPGRRRHLPARRGRHFLIANLMTKPYIPTRRLYVPAALLLAALGSVPAEQTHAQDLAAPAVAYRAPYLPARDTDILEQVPEASDPGVRAMASLRTAWLANLNDLKTAEPLARAYIDFGRRVGDARYAGYAEAVIAPWMASASPEADVLMGDHPAVPPPVCAGPPAADPRAGERSAQRAGLAHAGHAGHGPGTHDRSSRRLRGRVADTAGSSSILRATAACAHGWAMRAKALRCWTVNRKATSRVQPPGFKAWVQGLLAETNERLGNWEQWPRRTTARR